jgi:hypothetical protein
MILIFAFTHLWLAIGYPVAGHAGSYYPDRIFYLAVLFLVKYNYSFVL